jgi:carboxypeptidase C (cathepsin A)
MVVFLSNLVDEAWRPWFADGTPGMPAGYATKYTVANSNHTFNFVTIRLAGHMVPTFQPAASLSFFSRFLAGKPY